MTTFRRRRDARGRPLGVWVGPGLGQALEGLFALPLKVTQKSTHAKIEWQVWAVTRKTQRYKQSLPYLSKQPHLYHLSNHKALFVARVGAAALPMSFHFYPDTYGITSC